MSGEEWTGVAAASVGTSLMCLSYALNMPLYCYIIPIAFFVVGVLMFTYGCD